MLQKALKNQSKDHQKSKLTRQESQTRMAGIIDSAMDAIISIDAAQRIILFNPAAEKMFGYAAVEIMGQTIERLIPVRFHEAHHHHIESFGATKTTRRSMGKMDAIYGVRADGEEFPIEASISQVEAQDEKIYTVILRDITQRKLAEAARDQLTRHTALQRDVNAALAEGELLPEILQGCAEALVCHLDAAFARIWTLNEKEQVLELQASAGLYTHLDGTHARVPIGKFKIGLIAEERLPHLTNDVFNDPRIGDLEWARREGLVAFAGYPLLVEDRIIGVLAMFAQVSLAPETLQVLASIAAAIAQGIDRKQSRQALQQSELQTRIVLQTALDGYICLDAQNRIVEFNEAFSKMLGYPRAELLQMRIQDIDVGLTTEEFRSIANQIKVQGYTRFESSYKGKDGTIVLIEASVTYDRTNERFYGFVHNITERKKLEAQFLRAQRLESIGTLASGIAHDLNNILSPVLMAVQLLQSRFTDEGGQQILQVLRQNVKRGSEMVKQILAFAKGAEGGRLPLQPEHVVKEVINLLKETFPKNIAVKYNVPANLNSINGDPTQIHQVLMNLCVNARDAMQATGGTLTITAENKAVDEHFAGMMPHARAGKYAVISISDTGTGIPAEVQDKMFDPFFTTKEPGNGTGLGLSTVLGIVKGHGGFLNVYSEKGKGTKFEMYLPALETDVLTLTVTPTAELPLGNNKLILVVDDEAAIREITQSTLENFGYRVLVAANGIEAIAVYAQHHQEIQLVLTDMMMPYMDGPAMISALQRINPAVQVIASTGLAESERAHKAAALGVKTFLTKPYTAQELLQILPTVLPAKSENSVPGV